MSAQVPLLDVPATAPRKLSFEFAVPLSAIEEKPGFNPRADYGEHDNSFAALVESVRARGILQPPLLRPLNLCNAGVIPANGTARFAVVAGHRRIAAAREAGLDELDVAVVVDAEYEPTEDEAENRKLEAEALAAYSEREQLLDALTENSLRRDLNPIEQARAAKRLAEMALDQEAIGKAFGGKSQTWVSRTLSLLDLHPAISCHLISGKLSREHGVELLRLKDFPTGVVSALANKAIEDELSAAAVRGLASTMIERRDGKAQPSLLESETTELPPSVNPTNAAPHTPATEAPAPVRHEAPGAVVRHDHAPRGESDTRHTIENQRASAEATRTLEVGPRSAPAPEPTELEKWAVGRFGSIDSALGVLRAMDRRVEEGFIYVPDDEMVFRLGRLVEHRRAEDPKFADVLAAHILDGLIYRRCVELELESTGEAVASAPSVEETPTDSNVEKLSEGETTDAPPAWLNAKLEAVRADRPERKNDFGSVSKAQSVEKLRADLFEDAFLTPPARALALKLVEADLGGRVLRVYPGQINMSGLISNEAARILTGGPNHVPGLKWWDETPAAALPFIDEWIEFLRTQPEKIRRNAVAVGKGWTPINDRKKAEAEEAAPMLGATVFLDAIDTKRLDGAFRLNLVNGGFVPFALELKTHSETLALMPCAADGQDNYGSFTLAHRVVPIEDYDSSEFDEMDAFPFQGRLTVGEILSGVEIIEGVQQPAREWVIVESNIRLYGSEASRG
jgi:ParB-like chromosome segregation protein Spo0J